MNDSIVAILLAEDIRFYDVGGCARQYGGHVWECHCMLPDEAGWLPCPPDARGVIRRAAARPSQSGEFCVTCGSPNMVRTGTCLTCQDCGSSSGGCS